MCVGPCVSLCVCVSQLCFQVCLCILGQHFSSVWKWILPQWFPLSSWRNPVSYLGSAYRCLTKSGRTEKSLRVFLTALSYKSQFIHLLIPICDSLCLLLFSPLVLKKWDSVFVCVINIMSELLPCTSWFAYRLYINMTQFTQSIILLLMRIFSVCIHTGPCWVWESGLVMYLVNTKGNLMYD